MDITGYETQIDALKKRTDELRQSMDSLHKDWLRSISEALVSWYECAMKQAVREQYHLVGTLGTAGMLALKERFVGLVQGTAPAVNERLSEPTFWSHKLESRELSGPLAKEGVYSLNQSGFLALMRGDLAILFGRLGIFLRENCFITPKDVSEAETQKGNFTQIVGLCSKHELRGITASYAGLHAELISETVSLLELERQWVEAVAHEQELQERRRIDLAKNTALDIWENAFSRGFGLDIDWNKAWDKAFHYSMGHDEWDDRYEAWLIDTSPKDGEDAFEVFLVSTGNVDKYERQVKRLWRLAC